MNNRISKIKKLREEQRKGRQDYKLILKSRLSKLVERYGIEEVSAASGWKESTIQQYLRSPYPLISPDRLDSTREILEQA